MVATASASGAQREGVVKSNEREAARRLGAVYLQLARIRALPLGNWVVPPAKGYGIVHGPFYAALSKVYGTDTERQRALGRAQYRSSFALYKLDYDAVVPNLIQSVLSLTKLLRRLTSELGLAERLQREAIDILERAGGGKATEQDLQTGVAMHTRAPSDSNASAEQSQPARAASEQKKGYPISYVSPYELKKIVRQRVAKVVRETGDELLKILFSHPEGVGILNAYSVSAVLGTGIAGGLVTTAIRSIEDFHGKLIEDNHALRYPFMVIGGVIQRQLQDIPGFSEYSVALGQVLTRDAKESLVSFASMAVGCLALVFAGPVGAAILAIPDLALAGMGVELAFVREREQEIGSQASTFRGDATPFATEVVYKDTFLAGAAAFLSAIAFFAAAKGVGKLLEAESKTARGVSAAERAATEEASRAAASPGGATVGARSADGASSIERPVAGGGATQKPETRYAAVPSTEAERLQASDRDVQANRVAEEQKALAGRPQESERARERPAPSQASEKLPDPGQQAKATPPVPEKVPKRKLPEQARKNLIKEIADLDELIAAEKAARKPVDQKRAALNRQWNVAYRNKDAAEMARLEGEIREVVDEYKSFAIMELNKDRLELKQALERNSPEYFDTLTSVASRKDEYDAVRRGALDPAFLPTPGERWVEHVYPRSRMFETPGFIDKLNWKQQIFLFNFKKNLKLVPANFNLLRGTQEYASLKPTFWSKYIKNETELANLSRLEREVQADVELLVSNPKSGDIWRRRFGYDGPLN
jgi:hypothetical protein